MALCVMFSNSLLLALLLASSFVLGSEGSNWRSVSRGGGHRFWGSPSASQNVISKSEKSRAGHLTSPLSSMYHMEEDDTEFRYTFQLPNDLSDDLSVEIDKDAVLHMQGTRNLLNPSNGREFVESKFSQSVSLSQSVDVDYIKVKRSKGKIVVVAPKIGRTKKLQIEDDSDY